MVTCDWWSYIAFVNDMTVLQQNQLSHMCLHHRDLHEFVVCENLTCAALKSCLSILHLTCRMEPHASTSQGPSGACVLQESLGCGVTSRVTVVQQVVGQHCVVAMAPVSPPVARMATPASVMRQG